MEKDGSYSKGSGRKKGTKNKVTAGVKANIVATFDKIGGIEAMTVWAKKNLNEFYRLYARLAPHEVTGTDENPIEVVFKDLRGL